MKLPEFDRQERSPPVSGFEQLPSTENPIDDTLRTSEGVPTRIFQGKEINDDGSPDMDRGVLRRAMMLNAGEWPLMLGGFDAILTGAIWPFMGIKFARIVNSVIHFNSKNDHSGNIADAGGNCEGGFIHTDEDFGLARLLSRMPRYSQETPYRMVLLA